MRKRLSQQTMHSTPVPVQVEMSIRKDSEPTEPGHQPRPTPNCGTPPHARPVHIEHNAHLLRSEFRRPMIVAIVKPGASRLHGPLALQPLHPHWRETTARGTGQSASASAELEPGGATQEPEDCATGLHTRVYVRLNDLNLQEREQHAAEKLAEKLRVAALARSQG